MTSESLRAGTITEESLRQALTTCRGDIFAAAGYLSCSPTELDRYIRASESLQAFAAAIEKVKRNPNYEQMSGAQFRARLEQITLAYKIEATEIIHEIASMPIDSAAMADVKLKAAIQLRGSHSEAPVTSEQAQVLQELNKLYSEAAPRIKSVRIAAQIEFDSSSPYDSSLALPAVSAPVETPK